MFDVTDFQKIGIGLTGFGVSFIFLGVLFFFDRGLLAIGNILFLCGLAFVIGLERTFRFFFQKHKLKGSAFFFGGIAIVLFGWPFVGICVETYGFILLFSGFFPVAVNFIRRIPVLGTILNLPVIGKSHHLSVADVIFYRAGIIVASSEVEERKAGGEVEGVSSTKRVSLTGSSVTTHQSKQSTTTINNNQQKKNSGRFEIFTNIFKKKNKEKDSEASTTTSVVSKKNPAEGFDYRENVLIDDEGEDKETSIVPTVTCTATSSTPSTAGEEYQRRSSSEFVVRESNSQASVISSQPIEIPLPSKSPMGHSLRYSDQEPFLAGSGYDNTAIEHYKYLSESEPIGDSSISPVVSPRVRSLHHDMQALRISRQDNPYLQQKLERTSISNGEDTPFSSPRKQEQEKLVDDSDEEDSEMNDEGIISLHQHLIRSPPPHFPQNVTKFRFPDTRSVAPASSPLVGKQLSDTLYDPTTGRSATPAYALDPNLPVTTSIAKVSNLNASQKEKMPLLPIDEKFLPQQNEAGDYQRWEAPSNKIPTASEVVFDREQMTLRNRQLSQGSCDLNPILIKSGVDVLDPGMREVLEFQKHKIVHETGLRLPEPLGTTAVGVSEVNVPVITGRLSAEGTVPTCHYISPRSSIGSSCSYNLKSLQTLQPMGGSIQPPSTAPTFPTSPTKPMMLPMKNVGMTSPPAALLSPLPPLGASVSTFLPSTEPLKSSSEGVFEPTKKLLAQ